MATKKSFEGSWSISTTWRTKSSARAQATVKAAADLLLSNLQQSEEGDTHISDNWSEVLLAGCIKLVSSLNPR